MLDHQSISLEPAVPEHKHLIIVPNIPDVVSLSGIMLAVLSIKAAVAGAVDISVALMLISLSADLLDGHIARKLNITRPFGRVLDSLGDVILYLIAPVVVLESIQISISFFLVLLLVIMSGVVRLAVFTTVGTTKIKGKTYYIGMPVVWMVYVTAALVAASWFLPKNFIGIVAMPFLSAYALLMVIKIPFPKIRRVWTYVVANALLSVTFIIHHYWHG